MPAADHTLTFELYRVDLKGRTLEELYGPLLADVTVASNIASGSDTVATMKPKVCRLFPGKLRDSDRVTLFIAGRQMKDHALFYADHFILLPAWIQVILHECSPEKLAAAIAQRS